MQAGELELLHENFVKARGRGTLILKRRSKSDYFFHCVIILRLINSQGFPPSPNTRSQESRNPTKRVTLKKRQTDGRNATEIPDIPCASISVGMSAEVRVLYRVQVTFFYRL